MQFGILGPLEIRTETGTVDVAAAKQRSLLAVLISRAGDPITADGLIERVWHGDAPKAARKALAWHILQLRNLLGDRDLIRFAGGGYRLTAAPGRLDHVRFATLSAEAESLTETHPEQALSRLDEALALWRGEPYSDIVEGSPREHAARLLEQRLHVVERQAALRLRLGRHAELVPRLTGWLAEYPFQESLRGHLMLALYRSGRQADALEVYREGRRRSTTELGLEPGAALRELERRILGADPLLDPPERTEPVAAAPPRPAQLPSDTGAFTGRDAELAVIAEAFGRPRPGGTVVVAVDGMAGAGKTTVALKAAHGLADRFGDGQLFIDLHGFSPTSRPVSPEQALERLLRSLGVSSAAMPADVDDKAALWRSTLGDRRILVLLDNAVDERQVRPLLPGSPAQGVLITSRRRLAGLDDARLLSIGALPEPEASRMFVACAGLHGESVDPDAVRAVVTVCGGLPLALRIAAARVRRNPHRDVGVLVERLSRRHDALAELDLGDRSVSAAFQVSYDELPETARRVLRLTALLPGAGFGTEVVAALADLSVDEAARSLDTLTDVHLLEQRDDGRYGRHDLIGRFARLLLDRLESPEAREAALGRAIGHHLFHAHEAVTMIYGQPPHLPEPPRIDPRWRRDFPDTDAAIRWCEREEADVLALLEGLADSGRARDAWPLAACFAGYMFLYEYRRVLHDLASRLTESLRGDEGADFGFASMARITGICKVLRGDRREAADLFEAALRRWRHLGDPVGEASVLGNLGVLCHELGEFDRAVRLQRETIDLARRLDQPKTLASAHSHLGKALWLLGDLTEAVRQLRIAHDVFTGLGVRIGALAALNDMGAVYLAAGDPDEAAGCHRAAMRLAEQDDEVTGRVTAHLGLGRVHRATGRHTEAVVHHRRAAELSAVGGGAMHIGSLVELGVTEREAGDMSGSLRRLTEAIALAEPAGDHASLAKALRALGHWHLAHGDPDSAVVTLERAASLREALPPKDAAAIPAELADARRAQSEGNR
ncbi:DNA-binding SARP family transcriptional activator [Stackebrandtia albiflava]|uniref:DNA-binding SARP family transcriptional activator n=1 Tax=Stackebrandtia albiflava TaxID=406432 RepID=A0A562VDW8_9ACTN|nr:BTAD domain-containing putative transcriptional regulator [Stackebrandtia albiflava]TWJ16011.1 DNA-binding SARP family transcriptional activator [Stackebrandtia albiflava]